MADFNLGSKTIFLHICKIQVCEHRILKTRLTTHFPWKQFESSELTALTTVSNKIVFFD